MGIEAIDHWVLVVKDLEETFAFYRKLTRSGWKRVGKSVLADGEPVPSSASARRRS